jgi:hypothetical protein
MGEKKEERKIRERIVEKKTVWGNRISGNQKSPLLEVANIMKLKAFC